MPAAILAAIQAAMAALGPLKTVLSSVGSSAAVAGAAFGLVGAAVEKLKGSLADVTQAIGSAAGALTEFVSKSNPAAVRRFSIAFQDLQAVIGQILQPALESLTVITRTFADAIINLAPDVKGLIAALTGSSGVQGVLGMVAGSVKELGRMFETVVRTAAPPLLEIMGAVGEVFKGVVAQAGPLVEMLAAQLGPVFRLVSGWVRRLADVWAALSAALAPLRELLAEIQILFASAAEALFEFQGAVADVLVAVIVNVVVPAVRVMTDILRDAAKFVRNLTNEFRAMLGLKPLDRSTFDPGDKSSVGASVRQAKVGDVQSVIREATSSAYGGSVSQKQLDKLGSISDGIKSLPKQMAKELADLLKDKGTKAVQSVVNSVPVTPLGPIGPNIGDLRKIGRYLFGGS